MIKHISNKCNTPFLRDISSNSTAQRSGQQYQMKIHFLFNHMDDYDYITCNHLSSISHEICTRFCCALLYCGHVIVHNEFTWSIIHIHQGCFAGPGAIVRLPQCRWSKPDGYGKISQSITTTKHSKAKTVCIFLGIYCIHIYISEVHSGRGCHRICVRMH